MEVREVLVIRLGVLQEVLVAVEAVLVMVVLAAAVVDIMAAVVEIYGAVLHGDLAVAEVLIMVELIKQTLEESIQEMAW